MRALRIAFFGLPLAGCLLARDGHELVFAVLPAFDCLPGRRRLRAHLGRARVLDAVRLGDGLDAAIEEHFAESMPDLLVSWFWPRRIPTAWLNKPRLGAIGAHPSLLPRHRGPNPYFWAIDQADERTGVSVHYLSEAYDEGGVLATSEIATGQLNAWQLARALDRPSLALLRQVVARFAGGERIVPTEQDEALATWAPEPGEDALRVSWGWSSERILRRIRALSPVPGLAVEIRGIRLFITAASRATDYPAALLPGEAATLGLPPVELVIRSGDGAISVRRATLITDPELDSHPELDGPKVAALVAAAGVIDCELPEGNG
jgi:methionyl-tRNA formyltransferase